jgi:tRNA threonylcarbamoyladenosine biosynthesis protein TsaB
MNLLAIDTSTEVMSMALQKGDQRWFQQDQGGANASQALIPGIIDMLNNAKLTFQQLDHLIFARGPGSFTGLRSGCAVVQGLALGANVEVMAFDSLLALAESARTELKQTDFCCMALLDARMGQFYVGTYCHNSQGWKPISPIQLCYPGELEIPDGLKKNDRVFAVGQHIEPALAVLRQHGVIHHHQTQPNATALLDLAGSKEKALLASTDAVPLYVRDKVAQTIVERAAVIANRIKP